jgi:hypothetical protein
MLSHSFEIDQDNRTQQDQAMEDIYLEGVGDGFDNRLPVMPNIAYLEGYMEGMRQLRQKVRLFPVPAPTEVKEYPLLCSQCYYLNNGVCSLKSIPRNSNSYACDRIKVDCPF